MLSVVIPAHNEEAVIGRCLSLLTGAARQGELEVIVVCNGCTDQTAQVARRFGPPVQVIETPVGNKPNALNLGDAVAREFPRFYVDADVELTLDSLRALAERLADGRCLAVAPHAKFDLSGCAWPVRAYYQIHERLPASREGVGGSGVYGISRAGRQRFNQFPPIIADDGFVRLQFALAERATLQDCRSVVHAPKTLRELIAIKTRSYMGTAQLRRLYPDLWRNLGQGNRGSLQRLALRPWLWPRLAAYSFVKVAARIRGKRRIGQEGMAWERDQTSRGSSRTKVLAVASGGGHWVQLLRLKPAFAECDLTFVTVNPAYRSDVQEFPFLTINDATRWNKFGLLLMLWRLLRIVRRHKPDVIVSTGAAPGYFAIRLGKLLGARTIWIDSIANVNQLSLSGRKIGQSADLWLTQWPHLAGGDGPKYAGQIV
jgi:glycosyltransferase involved in cell wall biosynthesis